MSLKGVGKSLVRAPQSIKQRFNMGEVTKDAVYIDTERRFQELEKETKKLHEESKKYFNAINGMLTHQIEYSRAIKELYKPISGRVSDPDSFVAEGNDAGIEACEQYEQIVQELKETIAPELEMIEQRVIAPADELLTIIKAVRKITVKRDHKQLDYDRHRATLKSLQDKKDKSLKDEKAIYKAEANAEQATQDFEYFNDLLKNELPQLFKLEREFIQPLFQSFYYMQLNVFYTLHERMQNMDIGYFDLSLDIEAAFSKKRGDIEEQVSALAITRFKRTGGPKPAGAVGAGVGPSVAGGSKYGINKYKEATSSQEAGSSTEEAPPPPYSSHPSASQSVAPPEKSPAFTAGGLSPSLASGFASSMNRANSVGSKFGPAANAGSINRAKSTNSHFGAAAKAKGPAPPPPKPKPAALRAAHSGTPTATALYDYEAQAEGDLSFSTGDVIEVSIKGKTENEWWTGKCNGREGQFPGNYVRLN